MVGVGVGDACLLGATFAGLRLSSELLSAVFRWLSLAGALYLIWLAAEALLVRRGTSQTAILSCCRKPLLDGLTIAFANPAALLFYTAFFPQFIDRNDSIAEQMIVLSALYLYQVDDRRCVRPHCCASGYRRAGHRLAGSRSKELPPSVSRSRSSPSLGSLRWPNDLEPVHASSANMPAAPRTSQSRPEDRIRALRRPHLGEPSARTPCF